MQINLQTKNMEMTEATRDYIEKKLSSLEKLIAGIENKKGEAMVNFELARTTNHHKLGEVFKANCTINISGQKFYGSAEASDPHSAVDEVKENIFHEISKNKDRKKTLYKRGATSVKKMLKGLSKRNPFTSKY